MGGTFDPIHLGHLVLAEETRLALALDRILFVPAAYPWRKAGRAMASLMDRLAMVRLATASNPFFAVSEIEARREGPTYTADTLDELRLELGAAAQIWFLLGADALLDLPQWKDPERILAQVRLAVAGRKGYDADIERQLDRLMPNIVARIDRISMPMIDISSTELRRRLRLGASTRYWLPKSVERYIGEHEMYRTTESV